MAALEGTETSHHRGPGDPGATSGSGPVDLDQERPRAIPDANGPGGASLQDLASSPDRFVNRELSWLDFNARVLALAGDPGTPLLERAKFLAIFSSNLDEFFQVRVAALKDQLAAGLGSVTADGRSPAGQLLEIRDRVSQLVARAEHIFLHEVVPELADRGIVFSSWHELDEDDRKYLDEVFDERIFPVLTPLAVDPSHPFPYISNLSLNLALVVNDPETADRRFARVKVPPLLPRFVVMPDGERFVPLEQIIAAHLGQLFPGMVVEERSAFRVTRNADLTVEEEEADDLLAAVEIEVRRRRFGRAVRMELQHDVSPEVRELLQRELDLSDEDTFLNGGPIDLAGLWAVFELDRPELKYEPYSPRTQRRLSFEDGDRINMFAVIRDGDVLVHHPYDSFSTSVEEFIRGAAWDPKVLAIKLTLYRTSGDSPIVESLIRAAERGKQVAALVEVKARFDEAANIEWARRLEQAGVHVVYGLVGLKTHTKIALVVREEGTGVHRYCHLGTGNYNPKTARTYEDIGLLTGDAQIGSDVSQLFNYLTGYARDVHYERLLVAPDLLRGQLVELIDGERRAAPGSGRIILKMNSLTDPHMIDELYAASGDGVSIDLLVRGICSLRPGVPGLSENIRARSIVGRYLEHSRIYHFANGRGPAEPACYIGSADLMERNLNRRVEALVPVDDPSLRERLEQVLATNLADDTLAWEMLPDGSWRFVGDHGTVDTHVRLQNLATERAPSDHL